MNPCECGVKLTSHDGKVTEAMELKTIVSDIKHAVQSQLIQNKIIGRQFKTPLFCRVANVIPTLSNKKRQPEAGMANIACIVFSNV
ncbi:Ankyrin repeat-containing protein [Sesbania bispinosa]|nr:Ankyrin repeat-containing protein [Sesbania bispinosa]